MMNQDETKLKSTAEAVQLERRVSKHTPGPWEIVHRDDDYCMSMTCIAQAGAMRETRNICRLDDDINAHKVIAITFHQITPRAGMECDDDDDDLSCVDRAQANSRLIAAAPDLLEALIDVVTISDRNHDAWDKAKAAIAKATGMAANVRANRRIAAPQLPE
jgi:hypothetical protein